MSTAPAFLLSLLAAAVICGQRAGAIEEDMANHGPLDGHAAKVFNLLAQMKLSDETRAKCLKVAEESQKQWRAWFAKNRSKVDRYQKQIEELRLGEKRAELKKVLAEKKQFMHTAPSLLRNSEPLKAVLSAEEYANFSAKLEELKKALHNPKEEQAPSARRSPSIAAVAIEPVRISADGTHFVLKDSGKRFTPWGFNYLGEFGTILEEYWADKWPAIEEDFREMKKLGANVIRVHLQLPTYMAAPDRMRPEALKRLRRLLDLARDTGLYLDLTGLGLYRIKDVPPWLDALDEAGRWKAQACFWREIARACKGHPAVFCYDLMNEPVITEPKPGEPAWLTGELEGFYFVQRIAKEIKGRTQVEIAAAWVKQMTQAIRKADADTLITVGVIPWAQIWPNAKPIFYAPGAAKHLDFVSVHFYPRKDKVPADLAALKVYDIGKPIVIEETFPMSCSHEEFATFITESRATAEGWISHYFGKTIAEHRKEKDLKNAIIATFLEYWQKNAP